MLKILVTIAIILAKAYNGYKSGLCFLAALPLFCGLARGFYPK